MFTLTINHEGKKVMLEYAYGREGKLSPKNEGYNNAING